MMMYKQDEALITEMKQTIVHKNEVAFWNIGQSGVVIKSGESMICIDPFLTGPTKDDQVDTEFIRAFKPPVSAESLTFLNGVLITHFHGDHLDPITLEGIANGADQAKFIVPASHTYMLDGKGIKHIIPISNSSEISIQDFRIQPIEAAHTSYEKDEQGNPLYFGYLIEVNGVKIYHSGDTVATEELVEQVSAFKPDIAFLPINGADYFRTSRHIIGNMNYREAADFGVKVGADLIIPNHYDLFPNNRENPSYFVDYIFHQYPQQKFHMMAVGERFIYRK